MTALGGKTAVVTGVTSGIGRALTQKLIAAGVEVAGIARDAAALSALASPRLRPFVADLANPAARGSCFARLAETLDHVDVIVLNAGEVVYEAPSRLPAERWRALFEVNLFAGLELVQSLRDKLHRGAHVVALSSVTSRFLPNARFAPYAATKAALERCCDGLRQELDPEGIKLTLIVPGLVDTPIYDKVDGFARTREKIRGQIPTWLSADDVAEAIVWTLAQPAHVVVAEMILLPQGQTR